MVDQFSVYLFGDQTDDARSHLRSLLRVNHGPILDNFLRRSFSRTRMEFLRFHTEHETGHLFTTLLELVDLKLKGPHKIALDHALTSICQFALFFKRSEDLGGVYPTGQTSHLIGLCTGSLTAAAISCCCTLLELLPVAIQVTVLSFHTGRLAAAIGAGFEQNSSHENASWALVVLGLENEHITENIKSFIKCKRLPKASQPYIGATSPRGVTICGTPPVLTDFRVREGFTTASSAWLPIYAPYHACHLYCPDDLEALLDAHTTMEWENYSQVISVISNEIPVKAVANLRDSLLAALKAIFLYRVDFDKIASKLESNLPSHCASATIVPILSGSGNNLHKALRFSTNVQIDVAKPIISPLFLDGNTKPSYQTTSRSKIAIVGASGRFPGANNVNQLWELLLEGRDVHSSVPLSRWSTRTHVDTSEKPRKNTSATPYGCWLDEPGLFDARFFGMSPREAEQVDPAQRLALMTTYEALEDGGIVPGTRSTQRNRVGVVYGVTSNDWMETNSAQNIDTYMIPGGNRAFIPGRINYAFNFSGPSFAIDTACSSSLAAIHIACTALWTGEADTMIAGGTNILTNPDFTAGLDRGHFLSRSGNCKTFDDEADGYCRGEGVGTVILKRLEDAIADGDPIKGVIVNACTNHSAESESITRPYFNAQRDIFMKVLDGLSPASINYVEMHGTGTQIGDATEMASVLEAIAPNHGPLRRSKHETVHVGSVKPNVGHGEAVAGVTSLVKVLLMMQHNRIPPHIGIKSRPNRKFPEDMAERGVRIASKPITWERGHQQVRYVLLNNFSAAGGNTTLLMEDVPRKELSKVYANARPLFPVVVSAKSISALQANTESLVRFLRNHPDIHIPSLSYTTTARRIHHSHRIAVSGCSYQEISSKLSNALHSGPGNLKRILRSVIFAFTGQGGHYMGMGRDLYRNNALFRRNMDRYDRLAINQGFATILPLLENSEGDPSIFAPGTVQLAVTCVQMALTKLWLSWGITPSAAIGHSLGHYAALSAAGVLSEADAIYIVGARARILQETCQLGTHLMLAVKASQEVLEPFLRETNLEIACLNSTQDIVLSGQRAEINLINELLVQHQIRTTALDLGYAFHSSQLDCALKEFESSLSGIHFGVPCIPVLCPRMGRVVREGGIFTPASLVDQFRGRVNILAAVEAAKNEKIITEHTTFIEIGHNATFTSILKTIMGRSWKALNSLKKNQNDYVSLTDALTTLYMEGFDIRWDQFVQDFADNLRVIELPHYKWDLKDYWIPYINDWSLRKGEPAQMPCSSARPRLVSRMIHSVHHQEWDGFQGSITLRSDLNHPEICSIVQGHKVNNLPLCTPSIYAEIAMRVGHYLLEILPQKYPPESVTIKNMSIEKALVAQPNGPQWLQTKVQILADQTAVCAFSSIDDRGVIIVHHATCTIAYDACHSPKTLQLHATQVFDNIKRLKEGLLSGASYRFNKNMIYRMVAMLADFDPTYRGLKEIVLDSKAMAGTSVVDLSVLPTEEDDSYLVHPAYLDSLSQLAGFVMNANDASDLDVECFVNHGWGSFKLYKPLESSGLYHSFVKMVKQEGTVWRGNLTVTQGAAIVAVFENFTLQGVPPRLLRHVLSSANNRQSRNTHALNLEDMPSLKEPLELQPSIEVPISSNSTALEFGMSRIIEIVSEESGIDKADLHDDTQLASLGIDSLLSLIITSRLREDINFDLGSEVSFFDELQTLRQVKIAYARSKGVDLIDLLSSATASVTPSSPTSAGTSNFTNGSSGSEASSPVSHLYTKDESPTAGKQLLFPATQPPTRLDSARSVTSVVLQAASLPQSKTLFLFPDGSGSATSYASLPRLSRRLSLVALACPYRQDPHNMTCTLDALLIAYIDAIKRRQPAGPYVLGGWSSGGVFAFCAAQILLDRGEAIENLLLLDSPPLQVGSGLHRLPDQFYSHCTQVGVFGQIGGHARDKDEKGRAPPEWLVPHFKATIELLADHCAGPLRVPVEVPMPSIALCWAGECALDGVRYAQLKAEETESEGVKFLAEKRKDFGLGLWAALLPGAKCHVKVLNGWDHFNMMYGDGAKELGEFIEEVLL